MTRIALIFGISGQDGAYLARLLLGKGYAVHGTSRDAEHHGFANLVRLGVRDRVQVHSATPTDFRSVFQVIRRVAPDEIYNLSGQSSVGLSFEEPAETLQSITLGMLNILETLRFIDVPVRIYNACSSDCFCNTGGLPATEETATWLKFASLNRKAGRTRQAHCTLLSLLGYDPSSRAPGQVGYGAGSGRPEVMLAYVKHQWSLGNRRDAFTRLQSLVGELG